MARGSRLESPLGSAASGLPSPGVRQPRGWTTLSGSELGSGAPAAVGPLPRAVTLALRSLLLLLRLGATFPWSPVPVPARAVHAGQGSAGGLSPHAVAGGGSPSRAGDMSPPPGGAPSGRWPPQAAPGSGRTSRCLMPAGAGLQEALPTSFTGSHARRAQGHQDAAPLPARGPWDHGRQGCSASAARKLAWPPGGWGDPELRGPRSRRDRPPLRSTLPSVAPPRQPLGRSTAPSGPPLFPRVGTWGEASAPTA